uniref:BPTI/Kunitz inhibitor domain-containing protein n=1 Tax=Eptatretus burgeri TaxID=7764 RepID=A0A8C4QMI2_EPTBU
MSFVILLKCFQNACYFCLDSQDTGPCRAAFQRWSYHAQNSTCHNFTYGGCRGNSNNFLTENKCLSICAPFRGSPQQHITGCAVI